MRLIFNIPMRCAKVFDHLKQILNVEIIMIVKPISLWFYSSLLSYVRIFKLLLFLNYTNLP